MASYKNLTAFLNLKFTAEPAHNDKLYLEALLGLDVEIKKINKI